MSDLISRQAALKGFAKYSDAWCYINALPTSEKKGKWEIDVDCEYDVFDIAGERTWAVKAMCSECGFAMRFIEGHGVFNYCPNCGCRMTEN